LCITDHFITSSFNSFVVVSAVLFEMPKIISIIFLVCFVIYFIHFIKQGCFPYTFVSDVERPPGQLRHEGGDKTRHSLGTISYLGPPDCSETPCRTSDTRGGDLGQLGKWRLNLEKTSVKSLFWTAGIFTGLITFLYNNFWDIILGNLLSLGSNKSFNPELAVAFEVA